MENKEMNLFDLCAAFGRWIWGALKWCCQMLLNCLRLSIVRWYIVLPAVLIGMAAGLYVARPLNRTFQVEAQVWLNGPTANEVAQAILPLAKELPEGVIPSQSVAQLLQMTPEQVKTVHRIETFPVIDFLNDSTADMVDYKRKHKLTDTTNVVMKQCVQLAFRTKRPVIAPEVGQALINYLNNLPEFRQSYEAKLQLQQQEADFYDKQIAQLDEIARTYYLESGKGATQVQSKWSDLVIGKREMKSLYPSLQDMINQSKKSHHELARMTAPVVAPQGFVVNSRAVNRYTNCGLIGIFLGYLLGCVVAYAVKRRKDIKAWLQKGK